MKQLADTQVAIVGLGLMGGSLAGALRGQCQTVIGIARRTETLTVALARGLIDTGTTDLVGAVASADIVVLATPVRVIIRLLHQISSHLAPGCLVMDLGSTKAEIITALDRLPEGVQPMGGHPMCGKEVAGIEAADPALYRGCTFVLTPLPRTSDQAQERSRELVRSVGGRPLVLTPDHHDQLVATASHLPYLLACALVGTAQNAASIDPTVWDVAASGFRDSSRLAASDVTMMLDILLTNREAVLEALAACQGQLRELGALIKIGDEEGLRESLTAVRNRRTAMQ